LGLSGPEDSTGLTSYFSGGFYGAAAVVVTGFTTAAGLAGAAGAGLIAGLA